MTDVVDQIIDELQQQADPVKADFFPRFFTTEPGQPVDQFFGVTVPKQRAVVAKYYKDIAPDQVLELLKSKVHEVRLTAVLIWVKQYQKGDDDTKKYIYELYLKNTKNINNWDLVDSSAHKIVGDWLLDAQRSNDPDKKVLERLSNSDYLWDRRIAMMATYTFIKENDFSWTLRLAEQYLGDDHHYIQKVTGWMLREVGKKDRQTLIDFLDKYASKMPRIMLRYSLEKLDAQQRQYYLKKK
jgi:3-methyladenine DNA glycosylase AlkD